MIITLQRFCYAPDCTRGVLYVEGHMFQTVERPWVSNGEFQGGRPFESCVPDGEYRLRSHIRPGGRPSFILSNPELGVWEQDVDRESQDWGRYLVLIHPGNTVKDVVGCIAPGMSGDHNSVSNSRVAFNKIHELLEGYEHKLVIEPKRAK